MIGLERVEKEIEKVVIKSYNKAIDDYERKLLDRLIPHLDDLEIAKDSETYLAITEIAESLKQKL